ncbi:MAG: molybdopterin biosynthesis protein, partial [Candidatus Methanoperedens sp.]|nr:molybdopterin biosynthesis protein [Candidatus Methanoperedens sp.]
MRKEFRKLVTVEEAVKIIDHLEIHPNVIEVKIENAFGHILAGDIVSQVDVPPFSRASMDGYAVIASDTYLAREDRPTELKIIGHIQAGKDPDLKIENGEAAEIATGAVMPSGANAVVMVEYTRVDPDLLVLRPVSINENVMHAGSDIMVGERILKRGTFLGAREIGVLAAVGKTGVNVYRLNV